MMSFNFLIVRKCSTNKKIGEKNRLLISTIITSSQKTGVVHESLNLIYHLEILFTMRRTDVNS